MIHQINISADQRNAAANPVQRYRHTQTGELLRFAALVPVPFLIVAAVFTHNTTVVAVVGPLIVILAIIGLIFSSLTIEIGANSLS